MDKVQFGEALGTILNYLGMAGALGTAAFGIVDATKFFRGGISQSGFGFIREALRPFRDALMIAGKTDLMETVHAAWLNGMPMDEQKNLAKQLIRLGLTPDNALSIAVAVGVDAKVFETAVVNASGGNTLTQADENILARFDALLEAMISRGYERADQQYRNSAKAAAALASVLLAIAAGWLIFEKFETRDMLMAALVGVIAVPLAPMAKDVASSLAAAVKSLKGE